MRGYEVILTVIQGGMIRDDAWLHDGDWICISVVALLRMGRCRKLPRPLIQKAIFPRHCALA